MGQKSVEQFNTKKPTKNEIQKFTLVKQHFWLPDYAQKLILGFHCR